MAPRPTGACRRVSQAPSAPSMPYSRAQFSRLVRRPCSARYRAATAGPSDRSRASARAPRRASASASPGRGCAPGTRLAHVRDDRARERRHVPPVRVARGHEPVGSPRRSAAGGTRPLEPGQPLAPGRVGGRAAICARGSRAPARRTPASGARRSPGTPPASAGSPPRRRAEPSRSTSGPLEEVLDGLDQRGRQPVVHRDEVLRQQRAQPPQDPRVGEPACAAPR